MQLTRHKPITRGVTELMYVGDDDAVENAVTVPVSILGIGAVGALVALTTKRPALRALAAGAAAWSAYRWTAAKSAQ